MAVDVAPGTKVQVKVVRQPRREAAVKTLDRLFRKDAGYAKELKRLKESRPGRFHRRGGRLWADRPPKLRPYRIRPGASCQIVASPDLIRDLNSLGDTVEVKAVS